MSLWSDLINIGLDVYRDRDRGGGGGGGGSIDVSQGTNTDVTVDVTPTVVVGVENAAADLTPIGDALVFSALTNRQQNEATAVRFDKYHDDFLSTLTGLANRRAEDAAPVIAAPEGVDPGLLALAGLGIVLIARRG